MYESGVPEKLIQERTGHRSIEALRLYERSNASQHQAVSKILSDTRHVYHHTERHSMSRQSSTTQMYNVAPFTTSGVSFQNLHGCTINITQTPPPQTTQLTDFSESELDKLFAEITDY